MPGTNLTGNDMDSKLWKKAFLVLSIAIILLMPALSHDYGQSGDEWIQIEYAQDIWNYFSKGDKQALDYSNKSIEYRGIQYYSALFDFGAEVLHRCLPSVPILYLRHFLNALTGALMMIFTGLLAWRLSRKWQTGVLALLFIFFSPRIFGESMNNPKDIPFACGYIITLYSFVALLQDYPQKAWRHALGLAIGFALAFGVRSAGGIMLLVYIGIFSTVYYLLYKKTQPIWTAENNRHLKKACMLITGALLAGYIIGLLAWPWGLSSPIKNPLLSVKEMSNREMYIKVLFEGVYRPNNAMPWYYELKWMLMTNPVVVLAGTGLFILLSLKASKKYGIFTTLLLLFCSSFPLVYIVFKHSHVYDTWRHVFFVYTTWVVMSALAFDMLSDYIPNVKLKMLPFAIAVLGLIPAIGWTIKSHPNQYVYFNEPSGGLQEAYGYYDLDYYENTGKQAADWIRAHAKKIPGRKVIVLSNMRGFDKYFAKDTGWIKYGYNFYQERHFTDYDYFVSYNRYIPAEEMQNNKWPGQNVVHSIDEDGVPLCVVIVCRSRLGIEANAAFQKKDFPLAVQKYREYLQYDTLDEYVYVNYAFSLAGAGMADEALAAANKAIEINPVNASYYDLLSAIYEMKGDKVHMQEATARGNSIKNEEAELNQPQ